MKLIKKWINRILAKFGYLRVSKNEVVINKKNINYSDYYKKQQLHSMLCGQKCEMSEKIRAMINKVDKIKISECCPTEEFIQWKNEMLMEKENSK